MPYRQLVTIPLSTGFTGTTWHLSVAYVPRLHEAGTLSDYALDWAQWPTIAGALSVNIFVNNAVNPINPARITTVSSAPSLDVWETLFGPATKSDQPVEPYRFIDRRQPNFREFPRPCGRPTTTWHRPLTLPSCRRKVPGSSSTS
jgi:hypothetical protein